MQRIFSNLICALVYGIFFFFLQPTNKKSCYIGRKDSSTHKSLRRIIMTTTIIELCGRHIVVNWSTYVPFMEQCVLGSTNWNMFLSLYNISTLQFPSWFLFPYVKLNGTIHVGVHHHTIWNMLLSLYNISTLQFLHGFFFPYVK